MNTPAPTPTPTPLKNFGISDSYANAVLNQHSNHTAPITVAFVKMTRLATRNARRAKLGLPPILDYSKI